MSKVSHENSKSKKGHNFVNKNGGLPPLLVWVPFLIVNNYSEFQVNILNNNRDIRKCQRFCTKILSRKRGIILLTKMEDYLLYWYEFPF